MWLVCRGSSGLLWPCRISTAGTGFPSAVLLPLTGMRGSFPRVVWDMISIAGSGFQVQTWKKIWSRLNDHSMPPPARKGAVQRRFPLDPSVRTSAVRAIATMLGSTLDGRIAPRRMSHETWLAVARDVGGLVLGSEKVEQIVDKNVARRGFLAKQTPRGHSVTYLLAIERASEELCRGVVSAEMLADDPHYGIKTSVGQTESRDRPIRALLSQIYGSPPTNSEVIDGELREGDLIVLSVINTFSNFGPPQGGGMFGGR